MAVRESQIRAAKKYQEKNNERMNLLLHKGEKEYFRKYANKVGMSLNGFLIEAVKEKIARIESGETKAK